MQFEGKTLENEELSRKLKTEKDKAKLMQIARITLKRLLLTQDIDFVDVEIKELKIGSLIIEYVLIVDTTTLTNKTLAQFNPVSGDKEVVVFQDVSHYKGKIIPAYSYISGKNLSVSIL